MNLVYLQIREEATTESDCCFCITGSTLQVMHRSQSWLAVTEHNKL